MTRGRSGFGRSTLYKQFNINKDKLGSLLLSGLLLGSRILIGRADQQGTLITDNVGVGLEGLSTVLLVVVADETKASGGSVELAADNIALARIGLGKDVLQIVVLNVEGQVTDEDGGLGDGVILMGTRGTTRTSTARTTASTTSAAATTRSRRVTLSTGSGKLDLDLTAVQFGTIQGLNGLLGVSLLGKQDETIPEGTGSTEDNPTFLPITNN